jgi:hypothetical protein
VQARTPDKTHKGSPHKDPRTDQFAHSLGVICKTGMPPHRLPLSHIPLQSRWVTLPFALIHLSIQFIYLRFWIRLRAGRCQSPLAVIPKGTLEQTSHQLLLATVVFAAGFTRPLVLSLRELPLHHFIDSVTTSSAHNIDSLWKASKFHPTHPFPSPPLPPCRSTPPPPITPRPLSHESLMHAPDLLHAMPAMWPEHARVPHTMMNR